MLGLIVAVDHALRFSVIWQIGYRIGLRFMILRVTHLPDVLSLIQIKSGYEGYTAAVDLNIGLWPTIHSVLTEISLPSPCSPNNYFKTKFCTLPKTIPTSVCFYKLIELFFFCRLWLLLSYFKEIIGLFWNFMITDITSHL